MQFDLLPNRGNAFSGGEQMAKAVQQLQPEGLTVLLINQNLHFVQVVTDLAVSIEMRRPERAERTTRYSRRLPGDIDLTSGFVDIVGQSHYCGRNIAGRIETYGEHSLLRRPSR